MGFFKELLWNFTYELSSSKCLYLSKMESYHCNQYTFESQKNQCSKSFDSITARLYYRGCFLKCFFYYNLSGFQNLLNTAFFRNVLHGLKIGPRNTLFLKTKVIALQIWIFVFIDTSFLAIHLRSFKIYATLSAAY